MVLKLPSLYKKKGRNIVELPSVGNNNIDLTTYLLYNMNRIQKGTKEDDIYFINVYAKNEKDDLTEDEKKAFKAVVDILKEE